MGPNFIGRLARRAVRRWLSSAGQSFTEKSAKKAAKTEETGLRELGEAQANKTGYKLVSVTKERI